MPRTGRGSVGGGYWYHVLNRGDGHDPVFHKPQDDQAFVGLIAETRLRHPMRLLAYGVESDHGNRGRSDHDNRWSVLAVMRGRSTGGLFSGPFCDALVRRPACVAILHDRRSGGTSRPSRWQRSIAA